MIIVSPFVVPQPVIADTQLDGGDVYKRQGLINSPILSQIDLSLMDYLQRKLSPDIFDSHMHNDIHILEMLEDLGVIFTIPHTVIIKSLYSVLSCLEQFKEDKELNMIQNLLVNGIVQQVVAE